MVTDHEDLLRQLIAAINTGVIPDELFAPDFVVENATTAVTDKTYHGREGALQWRNDFFDVFKEGARFEYRVDKSGPDYVVGSCRITGAGSASDVPLDFRWTAVVWFRGGQITRAVGYTSREEALRAVGLSQEP